MFNNSYNIGTKSTDLSYSHFFIKKNRSLLSRFYNFTFNTFDLPKKKKFFSFFRKLYLDNKFFLKKNVIVRNKNKIPFYKKKQYLFSWLFFGFVKKCRYHFAKNERGFFFIKYQLLRKNFMPYLRKVFKIDGFFFFQKKNNSLLFSVKKKQLFEKKTIKWVLKKNKVDLFFIKIKFILINRKNLMVYNLQKDLLVNMGFNKKLYFFLNINLFGKNISLINPNQYILKILYKSSNRLVPFVNKNKSFISKREVSLASLYFFIEKNDFFYKNSYFFGLLLKKKRGSKSMLNTTFNVLSYKFSKKPYTLSTTNIGLY